MLFKTHDKINLFSPIDCLINFSKISHRKWDHICWIHSGRNGKFYVNAELSSEIELPGKAFDYLKDYKDETFDMMLGQEPDSWVGDFNPKQTLRGRISEFNVWDYQISMDMLAEMAQCKQGHKGNIAKWGTDYVDFYNVEAQDVDYAEFCTLPYKLMMISEKMLLSEAVGYCKIHGGYLHAPDTKEKNGKLLEMLRKKYDECRVPNLGHTDGECKL